MCSSFVETVKCVVESVDCYIMCSRELKFC